MIYFTKDGRQLTTNFITESDEHIICPWCGHHVCRDELVRDYNENANLKICQCDCCFKWFELVESFKTYKYERKHK